MPKYNWEEWEELEEETFRERIQPKIKPKKRKKGYNELPKKVSSEELLSFGCSCVTLDLSIIFFLF